MKNSGWTERKRDRKSYHLFPYYFLLNYLSAIEIGIIECLLLPALRYVDKVVDG